MNKLLEKKNNYIDGSAVRNPLRREHLNEEKRLEEIERKKREKIRRLKAKEVRSRWAIIQIAVIFLVLGVSSLIRDSKIYKMQNNLSKLGNEVKLTAAQNEALRVSLLKASSLQNIEREATSKLGMSIASKKDVTYIDTSKDFLGSLRTEEQLGK